VTYTKSLVVGSRSGEVIVTRYITERTGHFKEVCMGHAIEGHFGEVYCAVKTLHHKNIMLLRCPDYVCLIIQWSMVVVFYFEAVLQSVLVAWSPFGLRSTKMSCLRINVTKICMYTNKC